MRRLTACVLMMTLLLSGCKAVGAGEAPEEAALALREGYQALAGWSAGVDISVCYTETVYDFTLEAQWRRKGETVLTVAAPEEVAGITARMDTNQEIVGELKRQMDVFANL